MQSQEDTRSQDYDCKAEHHCCYSVPRNRKQSRSLWRLIRHEGSLTMVSPPLPVWLYNSFELRAGSTEGQ